MTIAALSDAQYIALACTVMISCSLSVVGSCAILRIVRRKLHEPYQRFVGMLSLGAVFSSFFSAMQLFLTPKADGYNWAFGNQKTCSLLGFFFVFGTTLASLYSASLAVYFLCSVKRRNMIRRSSQPPGKIELPEKLVHAFCWTFPAVLAIVAAATKSYGLQPELGLCVIYDECSGPEESGCVEEGLNPSGSYVTFLSTVLVSFHITALVTSPLVGIVATVVLYLYVRKTLLKGRQHTFESQQQSYSESSSTRPTTSTTSQAISHEQLREVFIQCFLYTLVYLNALVWTLASVVALADSSKLLFALRFLIFLFSSSQGTFNVFVYVRPRVAQLRKKYPQDSYWTLLRMALSKADDPDSRECIRRSGGQERSAPPSSSQTQHVASDSSDPAAASSSTTTCQQNETVLVSEASANPPC